MNNLNFFHTAYANTSQELLSQLYGLRKEVFADRLNWNVNITNGFEYDAYDNAQASYLIGSWQGVPLAGLRLINTLHPYMVEVPFRHFFEYAPPKHALMVESSRFFVDKTRSRALGLAHVPLTEMLLFALHNHAARQGLTSVITVVSHAMSRIVRKAGWDYEVLATGNASPGEKVLLLDMTVTAQNHAQLLTAIAKKYPSMDQRILQWPAAAPAQPQVYTEQATTAA
jgi:N-acyl-L-homoserine lactone synthetase